MTNGDCKALQQPSLGNTDQDQVNTLPRQEFRMRWGVRAWCIVATLVLGVHFGKHGLTALEWTTSTEASGSLSADAGVLDGKAASAAERPGLGSDAKFGADGDEPIPFEHSRLHLLRARRRVLSRSYSI